MASQEVLPSVRWQKLPGFYLYFTVFSSGLAALGIEISASRLLGSVFGNSNLVWATIIGLILVYLSIGYLIGGFWADRSPKPTTMYSILAWAGFLVGVVPFISRPILRFAANAFDVLQLGALFGSFLVVLILFAVPVTMLGMISPFAIRLAITDTSRAGRTSGNIYATSTLGSFIGTFLPPLVMIPLLGTTLTFVCFSLFLLVVAIIGLCVSGAQRLALLLLWMPLVILLLEAWWAGKPIKTTPGQIFETESAYNYIQVIEQDGYRLLRLNEGQGIHSVFHPDRLDLPNPGPWEQFLAGPFLNEAVNSPSQVKNIAIVGLAAGTLARQASAVFGPVEIDGFEIDPEIIQVGRDWFGMNQPNLAAIAEDGRLGLAQSSKEYDLVAIDAYRPPYIPWHLTTREFFEEARGHLAENGVLAINVGSDPSDSHLLDGLVGTLQNVFPSVYVVEIPGTYNYLVYATNRPTRIENLYTNYVTLATRKDTHPLLLASVRRVIENLMPTPQSETIFTDDRAPIEWITNNMVLNYIFYGETDSNP